MKKVVIFGSTGSIGKQTLEVIEAFPGEFKVMGLTARKNMSLLREQGEKFSARTTLSVDLSFINFADYVINAVPGFAGLRVSKATLEAGKTLLCANKESLAIGGKWLRELGGQIFPLDSEASAIWQLMHEHGTEDISSVTLTCSGGPFLGKTAEELKNVTLEEALDHPTWKMGPKVSLDSATLINKVLEVYEVHKLFDIPLPKINIMIHPQSLVHAMIHTKTKATKMHITQNDMRLFISYALHYPNQPECPWPIQRAKRSEMNFEAPDPETFRSLKWLEQHKGNPNFPIVLNALNDLATKWFLDKKMRFLEIYDFIEAGLERWLWEKPPTSLEEMIAFHHRITKEHEYCPSPSRRKIPASQTEQALG